MPNTLDTFITGLENEEFIDVVKSSKERVTGSCGVIIIQHGITDFQIIELKDVLYIFEIKKSITIFMKNGKKIAYPIHLCKKKEELIDDLANKYDNFKGLISGKVVNLDNVVNYSNYLQKVFFANGSHVDVTRAGVNIVASKLGKEKDIDTQKSSSKGLVSEYYPLR